MTKAPKSDINEQIKQLEERIKKIETEKKAVDIAFIVICVAGIITVVFFSLLYIVWPNTLTFSWFKFSSEMLFAAISVSVVTLGTLLSKIPFKSKSKKIWEKIKNIKSIFHKS